jgi:hypothetical protein
VEARDLARKLSDAMSPGPEMPFVRSYHPLGFRVDLTTNSREVLECAQESWGMWMPRFAADPVQVRVLVQDEGELAIEPEFRAWGHLFSIVADRHNYAVMDLDRLFAYASVSRKTASDHAWFRWFFLDNMALFMLAQRHAVAVHAACVARDGRGILLGGESCAGKSTLAWACARSGWTYVGDDAAWLRVDSSGREVMARSHIARFRHDAAALFPELEGYLSRVRPNGKVGIEVPTSGFAGIRTASHCDIAAVVFLDRSGREPAGLERVATSEAEREFVHEESMHREEILARHRVVIRRLLEAPAYRMRYKSLEEGISLLGDLHERLRA